MNQDQLKQLAAREALRYVVDGSVIGIGTGSTVNLFIEALIEQKHRVRAAVSSSERSSALLRAGGIEVLDLNQVQSYPIYVDGADEVNHQLQMIKGGGAALTCEKIVAALAEKFVCIVDASKLKTVLGAFALPVEVIPLARAQVARALTALGGQPRWREGVVTDNGNHILDVAGLQITDPVALETTINNITGVVESGLFARKPANIALIAEPSGVKTLNRL
jgi:ribose 5-phosphate isomerase A